ncbi:MAG: hypothetical protein V4647_08185 [Pseudomonadota bacterium]
MKFMIACVAGLLCLANAANAVDMLHEETVARAEEQQILARPIAGIENRLWFNYRINVTEAQKELSSNLRHSSDIEDLRDAWEEYAVELRHERRHYIKEMAELGYRGTVTIEG